MGGKEGGGGVGGDSGGAGEGGGGGSDGGDSGGSGGSAGGAQTTFSWQRVHDPSRTQHTPSRPLLSTKYDESQRSSADV